MDRATPLFRQLKNDCRVQFQSRDGTIPYKPRQFYFGRHKDIWSGQSHDSKNLDSCTHNQRLAGQTRESPIAFDCCRETGKHQRVKSPQTRAQTREREPRREERFQSEDTLSTSGACRRHRGFRRFTSGDVCTDRVGLNLRGTGQGDVRGCAIPTQRETDSWHARAAAR